MRRRNPHWVVAQLFPEPTPLEAFASIDRLYHDAVERERKASRAKDRRVARYWSEEAERLRELRSRVMEPPRRPRS